jgi:hypothetical protein
MTHWLAEQMIKGTGPFSVNTLVGPDGTVWNAGDLVFCMFDGPDSALTNIQYIIPGVGDIWEPNPPGGDVDAVWRLLTNGYYARPFLLKKVIQ